MKPVRVVPHRITYDVTTLQNRSVRYTEESFCERIKDDKFLENMQCFHRYMHISDELEPENSSRIDQTPCLIVREVVPEEKFMDYGFYCLDNVIDHRNHRQDCLMITYLKTAEPVPKDSVLFNNKMEILLAPNEFQRAVGNGMNNAQILRNGLSALSSTLSSTLN